jgi:hypothetical protein
LIWMRNWSGDKEHVFPARRNARSPSDYGALYAALNKVPGVANFAAGDFSACFFSTMTNSKEDLKSARIQMRIDGVKPGDDDLYQARCRMVQSWADLINPKR